MAKRERDSTSEALSTLLLEKLVAHLPPSRRLAIQRRTRQLAGAWPSSKALRKSTEQAIAEDADAHSQPSLCIKYGKLVKR